MPVWHSTQLTALGQGCGVTLKLHGREYFRRHIQGSDGNPAFGINNHGEIVGDYTDSMGTMHGFVYIGGVFYAVDDLSGVAGSTVINGVNDLGQLVGFSTNANAAVVGFMATPTPEPGTLALTGSGMLAGLGFLRRKLMR